MYKSKRAMQCIATRTRAEVGCEGRMCAGGGGRGGYDGKSALVIASRGSASEQLSMSY